MKRTFLLLLLGAGLSMQAQTLQDVLSPYFRVGCAVNASIVRDRECKANQLIRTHYNQIVAENCMKEESLSPAEGVWNWQEADEFVQFGEENNLQVIGHCLVWHSQAAEWMFVDQRGEPIGRDELIERMRNHIATVVGRYKGRVFGWDVCNECFEDDGTMRESKWYKIIGPDFIELAFQFAHEADPDAQLYYNDYNMSSPGKVEAVCRMVEDFKAKGIRIDAVGMQSHHGLTWPKLVDYDHAITAYAKAGVRVNITELDLNVLPTPEGFGGAEVSQKYRFKKDMDPYAKGIDPKNEALIGERWQAIFMVLKNHADQIDRVTFWGVGDLDSWMNDWPIHGRHAYSLLFDREYNPKPVINDIIRIFE